MRRPLYNRDRYWISLAVVFALFSGGAALAGGFSGGSSSAPTNAQVSAAAAPLIVTGATDTTQLKVIGNPTQTTPPFQIFQSDGTTNVLSVTNAGAVTTAGAVNGVTLATSTITLGAGAGVFQPTAGQDVYFQVNGTGTAHIRTNSGADDYQFTSGSGATFPRSLTPGFLLSGAGALTWTSGPITSTQTFAAFLAGQDQSAIIAITGAALGDGCTVAIGSDQTACIGAAEYFVTGAGTGKLVISPVTTTTTCTPTASTVFTIRCTR